ncbi:hypothetical protein VTK73DRAFT_3793 [Phialemonium thermophilum]|uniref:N-acetyltransferase domain-containing protein n=1 Tax=Phialemonium thermophilum TaxID=223376 RepID=A0ABR3WX36_9PEZI
MNSPINPRIRVRDAVPSDVPEFVEIYEAAFGPGVMDRLMYPGGMSQDAKEKFSTGFAGYLLSPEGASAANAKSRSFDDYLKVAELLPDDNGNGGKKVVAFAKWHIRREPQPEEVWNVQREATAESLGEGANPEVHNQFIGGITRKRIEWTKGDPYVVLGLLATHPNYGRLGAATSLIRWGVEIMDREGLPGWLESSAAGWKIYKKFGFEDVDVLDLDISKWNPTREDGDDWGENIAVEFAGPLRPGMHRVAMMRRPPKQ